MLFFLLAEANQLLNSKLLNTAESEFILEGTFAGISKKRYYSMESTLSVIAFLILGVMILSVGICSMMKSHPNEEVNQGTAHHI